LKFQTVSYSQWQQEGLSFINLKWSAILIFTTAASRQSMADKLSSVLDIQYKKPRSFGGSAYVSILEQGVHLEGNTSNDRSVIDRCT
jgi:hypothetical protein